MKSLIIEDAEEPPSSISGIIPRSIPGIVGIVQPGCYSFSVSGMDITVEKCGISQLQEIISIEFDSFPDYIAYSESFIGDEISAGKYYAALDGNGRVIGYFGLDLEDETIYISNIAVKHEFTRKGIGKMLIECIRIICEELGIRIITLHVSEYNPSALDFYRSYGFVIDSLVPEFYAVDDQAYSMVYRI